MALVALAVAGCAHQHCVVSLRTSYYELVLPSFVMLAREDVEDGKSVWGNGSGFCAVDNGTNYLYTARHVVQDRDGKLPNKLYATNADGTSWVLDVECLEVPEGNQDVARFRLDVPICPGLKLSNRAPGYGETLYFFGDAFGAGVMNAEVGVVVGIGPLEFEHTADIVRGMSGGPVVNEVGEVVGVCQKGRKRTAKLNGETLPDDSKYLKVRKFAANLAHVKWKRL